MRVAGETLKMFTAFAKAVGQLGDPRILRLLLVCVALSATCFVASGIGIWWLLDSTRLAGIDWIERTLDVLGWIATAVLTWFLFPLVASAFVALFLDRVAAAVEARHYPDLPPAQGIPIWQALKCSVRFLLVVIALNVLLLLLWFVPLAYPIGYYAVNGYLLGREYFDLIAHRRLDPVAARALRHRNSTGVMAAGVVGAVLLTVPFVNFVAPVLLTAAMVHRCEAWRRAPA